MKINKIIWILFIITVIFTLSTVNASDMNVSQVDNLSVVNEGYDNVLTDNPTDIYVDAVVGYDTNDGLAEDSSLKTIKEGISKAKDNDNIYLADGVYSGLKNTRLGIDKSLNFIGSKDTVIDGENENYIFNITNGVKVTFKNIKFINAFKSPNSYYNTYMGPVYGAALSINNSTVVVDNCSFIHNVGGHNNHAEDKVYGGAVSNFGNLTILNSYFEDNTALSASGMFSSGGSIYNKGELLINNSVFNKADRVDYVYGSGIANYGNMIMDRSILANFTNGGQSKGAAIYNDGNFTLLNSIVENNRVGTSNFAYGSVYNNGNLIVRGTVFRKNTAQYMSNRLYKGSSVIYNMGDLNVTYSAFMENLRFKCNREGYGITSDVYRSSGNILSLDNNWWGSNDNPTKDTLRILSESDVNTWLIFNVTPEYSKLNIGESGVISAMWTDNLNQIPQIDLFPLFNVTFTVDYSDVATKELENGKAAFTFDDTQTKGQYIVEAIVGDFTQEVMVDVGKISSDIAVESNNNILFNETLLVNISLTDANNRPLNGDVSVEFMGETYYPDLANGKATLEIEDLKAGNYTLKVIYEGDDDHFKSFYTKSITIKKLSVDLSLNVPDFKVGEQSRAYVTLLTEGAEGNARVFIDGVEQRLKIGLKYNITNDRTVLRNIADGEHNITVEFVETSNFYSKTVSAIFKVTLYDSSMNVSAKDIKVGETAVITITVNSDEMEGEAILIINGHEETVYLEGLSTDVTFSNLKAGTYNVSVYFDENPKFYPVNASTSFKVSKTPSKLDVNLTLDDNDDLKATLAIKTIPSDCTGVISVWVNYRQYNVTLKNGEATVDIELDRGSNLIFVGYEGDDYYEDSNWNTTIGVADKVILIGRNSTGWSYNEFDYAIRLTEENGVPMSGMNVTVEFDGEKHNITTNANGLAYYTLRLPTGTYDISATYGKETIHNTLTVKGIDFNVTSQDIVYGDVEVIEASFDSAIKGKVNFIIVGILNKTVDIVDNKATCNVFGLNANKYTVKAVYMNGYTTKQKNSKFNVDKATLNINVDIKDVVAKDDEIITVSNLSNATGKIVFVVNGSTYKKGIKNGVAILNLSKLNMGSYSLSVDYGGDSNYYNASYATVFYIKGLTTQVTLTINNAAYGADLIAKAILNKNATGTVRFTTEDLSKDVSVKNGVATWTFSGINAGKHEIAVKYLGDNYYVSSDDTAEYTVSKAKSSMVLYVKEVYLNENIRIYTNLSANATGKVLYSMNGYYSPRNKPIVDSVCHWYISPLDTGNYTVIAVYAGDDNYYGCNVTFILKVTQIRTLLDVEINDAGLNDRVSAKINLKSVDGVKLSDDIVLKVNDKSYDISVENGESTVVLGKLPAGNYTFEATYKGFANYSKASSKGKFEVKDTLLDVVLTSNNVTKYYKGSGNLIVSLSSSKGKAIEGNVITVKINGKTYTGVTDSSGKASFEIDLSSGKYTAVIESSETKTYHSASTKASVTINPTVEGIDVVKLEGSDTLYYAIFSDSNGKVLANKKLQLKIGSKSLSVTTLPNGIVRVNIDVNVGTYSIVATNPVTGEKATNTLFVFNYLMGNKDLTKYYKGSQSYKVRAYGANGKPVGAGQIVKIKVHGVTYNVKTDKKGYATLKINLKPGKYTIKATYKKYTVTNKIKVKSTLITKNLSKKKSKKIKYTAKLLSTKGNPLKGKKITFKFKGKTYKAITNKKGIATITIKASKLKVGKHVIYTSYGKLKMKNTISIKK